MLPRAIRTITRRPADKPKDLTMTKTLILTAALIGGIALPSLTFAETPNRTTMSFEEFVNASGCVIVDKGGYANLEASQGGNCPFAVTQAFVGNYSVIDAGADGVLGTSDDFTRSDN